MSRLDLEDFGTERDHFVAVMLRLKAHDPDAYEALRMVMHALVGDVKLDAGQRATLVETHRKLFPTSADWIESVLARGAAS